MPTSEYAPTDTLQPATPVGYQPPQPFRYSLVVLLGLVVVLLPVAAVVFGWLLWYAQGPALDAVFSVDETATSVTFTFASGLVAVACVGAIGIVTVLHELVHGLVYRWYGYRVSYGVAPQLGAFYAATFHQFQARNHNLIVGIAPVVALNAVLLPVLFVPSPLVAFAAFVALLFNTAGAAGDLYLVAMLLRTPAGSLMYDSDIRHSYIFYPEM
ncbi:Putative zincin peptidase [Haloarcula vallismortis]|uniref:DUF3267 domain-containing protein n=2 Tax=Haloarcula vallismortis TaxID=28442 RepID=M0JD15_HALVA|nr:DUF3267 domain-containing protein [Haloarcula vallismortis]EMA05555.1 hypothetical protein C437_12915 [Haloarcula vallismortis ATCC 29715]SDW85942.1 Putative zincin peptidase [Haloarcula vallismortis]